MWNFNTYYSDVISSRAEKNLSIKVVVDLILLIIAALPIAIFYTGVFTPYKRGFFCDDETIRYPHKPSTIPESQLYIAGLTIGVLTILLCEYVRNSFVKSNDGNVFHFFGRKVPPPAVYLYSSISLFLFGACIVEVMTDFFKYPVGRLRPNFIDVCRPDFNCSTLENPHTYVENYNCTNRHIHKVEDARMSFPSSHSSFSVYTILFSVIYLHKSFISPYSNYLKPALQFLLILIAAFTAVSRIMDNKHHVTDVVSGSLLGVLTAILMFYIPQNHLVDRVDVEKKEEQIISTNIELNGSV